MASFRGTFDFTLDAKGRLTIPSKFRSAFADGIVVAAGLEGCLGVWRPSDFDAWVDGVLAGHSPLTAEYRKLERFFSANSFAAELDGAGRVMIPATLARHAKLDREVSLVGTGKSFELWDRGAWAAYNDDVVQNIEEIAAGLGGGGS